MTKTFEIQCFHWSKTDFSGRDTFFCTMNPFYSNSSILMGVFHGKVNQSVGPNALVLSDDLCRVFSTEAAIKTDSKPLDKNKKDLCLSDVVHKHVDISKCIDPGLHPMLSTPPIGDDSKFSLYLPYSDMTNHKYDDHVLKETKIDKKKPSKRTQFKQQYFQCPPVRSKIDLSDTQQEWIKQWYGGGDKTLNPAEMVGWKCMRIISDFSEEQKRHLYSARIAYGTLMAMWIENQRRRAGDDQSIYAPLRRQCIKSLLQIGYCEPANQLGPDSWKRPSMASIAWTLALGLPDILGGTHQSPHTNLAKTNEHSSNWKSASIHTMYTDEKAEVVKKSRPRSSPKKSKSKSTLAVQAARRKLLHKRLEKEENIGRDKVSVSNYESGSHDDQRKKEPYEYVERMFKMANDNSLSDDSDEATIDPTVLEDALLVFQAAKQTRNNVYIGFAATSVMNVYKTGTSETEMTLAKRWNARRYKYMESAKIHFERVNTMPHSIANIPSDFQDSDQESLVHQSIQRAMDEQRVLELCRSSLLMPHFHDRVSMRKILGSTIQMRCRSVNVSDKETSLPSDKKLSDVISWRTCVVRLRPKLLKEKLSIIDTHPYTLCLVGPSPILSANEIICFEEVDLSATLLKSHCQYCSSCISIFKESAQTNKRTCMVCCGGGEDASASILPSGMSHVSNGEEDKDNHERGFERKKEKGKEKERREKNIVWCSQQCHDAAQDKYHRATCSTGMEKTPYNAALMDAFDNNGQFDSIGQEHLLLMHIVGMTKSLPHQPRMTCELPLFMEAGNVLSTTTTLSVNGRVQAWSLIRDALDLQDDLLYGLEWYDTTMAMIMRHSIRWNNGIILSRFLTHLRFVENKEDANVKVSVEFSTIPGRQPNICIRSTRPIAIGEELIAYRETAYNISRIADIMKRTHSMKDQELLREMEDIADEEDRQESLHNNISRILGDYKHEKTASLGVAVSIHDSPDVVNTTESKAPIAFKSRIHDMMNDGDNNSIGHIVNNVGHPITAETISGSERKDPKTMSGYEKKDLRSPSSTFSKELPLKSHDMEKSNTREARSTTPSLQPAAAQTGNKRTTPVIVLEKIRSTNRKGRRDQRPERRIFYSWEEHDTWVEENGGQEKVRSLWTMPPAHEMWEIYPGKSPAFTRTLPEFVEFVEF